MIVQTYEDRIKEAMLENSELRDSLVVLETELDSFLLAQMSFDLFAPIDPLNVRISPHTSEL